MTIRGLLRDHLGIALSLAGATFVMLRVLAVAGFDYQTAATILQAQSTSVVILGSLTPALTTIPVLGLTAISIHIGRHDNRATEAEKYLPWFAAFTLLGIAFMPWTMALVVLLMSMVLVAPYALLKRRKIKDLQRAVEAARNDGDKEATRAARRALQAEKERTRRKKKTTTVLEWTMGAAALLVLLLTVFDNRPWMPLEQIEISGESHVGYVLADDGAQLTVLQQEPRTVIRLDKDHADRTYCRPKPTFDGPRILRKLGRAQPIIGVFTDTTEYPECESAPGPTPEPT